MTPSIIAHYRITGKLGEGGMGEVYRATDTKLGREVAIKVISESFAQDPDRLARFTREAQVLASLNHPNIAAIHGVEERALVLELVEGETLAGPLPLDTVLHYAAQIADALEYAHEKGVVHRDLKPANVKVTGDGLIKVLDFGLAKALGGDARTPDPHSSPTLTMRATVAGVIMGTAGYMSPEQAKGKPVDRRADIWAFGVVLWEMLTGRPLFGGDSVAESLSQVLTKEPDLTTVPVQVRRLLRSCLQKEPKQRLRSIGDWRLLLDEPSTPSAPAGVSRTRRLEWAILALTAVVVGFTVWSLLHRPAAPSSTGSYNLYMVPPEGASFHLDSPAGMQSISPDGRTLAFIADSGGTRHIYVRPLDAPAARLLVGTELADGLFWSADSQHIAFATGSILKIVEVASGAVREVCDAGSTIRGGTWNQEGTILFGATSAAPIRRIAPDTKTPVPATIVVPQRESTQVWPQFLPDGRHFLYWVRGTRPEASGIYAGSLDVPPEAQIHRQIVSTTAGALYSAGHLLFVRGKTLFAQRFDLDKLMVQGSPVAIADNVAARAGMGQFSVSKNGILTISGSAVLSKSVTLVARDGSVVRSVGTPDAYTTLRLSPDGGTVALSRADGEAATFDIWLMDLARGNPVRLTDGHTTSLYPIWSPDGKELIYASSGEGVRRMYRKAATGNSLEQAVQPSAAAQYPYDWSRGGNSIAYWEVTTPGHTRLLVLPLEPRGQPTPLPLPDADVISPRFSPNGKWIAFASNETGAFDIYVQPVPGQTSSAATKVRVSYSGGLNPAWNADGSELYFNSPDDRLMAASVKAGGEHFEAGEPKPLFALGGNTQFLGGEYWEPINNGQQFVVLRPVPATERDNRISVIVNWQAALKD